jgi:predicted N-acetyltransferase YhbS
MPSPIPIILIGRLAVDERYKGHGLGASLLQDAVLKGIEASRILGARAFVVDALNESAETFYRKFGFELMPPAAKRAMFMLIADAEATIQHEHEHEQRVAQNRAIDALAETPIDRDAERREY